MTRYVGVDLQRRRSVIVVLDGDGTELWSCRIDNDPLALGREIEKAGPDSEVVLEETWGWYRAADVIVNAGGRVHLAHPLGMAGFENRRVKNDREDARLLADLLRMGSLPESWIPPESVRYQRELLSPQAVAAAGGPEVTGACRVGQEGLVPRWVIYGVRGVPTGWTSRYGRCLRNAGAVAAADHQAVGHRDHQAGRPNRLRVPRRCRLSGCPGDLWGGPSAGRHLLRRAGRRDPVPLGQACVLMGGADTPPPRVRPPRSSEGRSPNKARRWCGGRRSRRCPRTTAATPSKTTTSGWRNAAARTRAGWRRPERCSRSSTTG
jgi:hypothetical protein